MLMPSNDYTWPFFSLTSEIQVGRELLNQFYLKKPKQTQNMQQENPQENEKAPPDPFPQKQMVWEWAMIGNTTQVKNKFLTTICLRLELCLKNQDKIFVNRMDSEIFLPSSISPCKLGDQSADFQIEPANISGFRRQKKGTAQTRWIV